MRSLVTSVVLCVAFSGAVRCDGAPQVGKGGAEKVVVLDRVVDGDTVRVATLDGQDLGRVRLLGFDAPEIGEHMECWGPEATEALSALLPAPGEQVTLVSDGSAQDKDQYGRLLRFIHVGHVDIGREMVAAGAGRASRDAPPSFVAAEVTARQEGHGLWGRCARP